MKELKIYDTNIYTYSGDEEGHIVKGILRAIEETNEFPKLGISTIAINNHVESKSPESLRLGAASFTNWKTDDGSTENLRMIHLYGGSITKFAKNSQVPVEIIAYDTTLHEIGHHIFSIENPESPFNGKEAEMKAREFGLGNY